MFGRVEYHSQEDFCVVQPGGSFHSLSTVFDDVVYCLRISGNTQWKRILVVLLQVLGVRGVVVACYCENALTGLDVLDSSDRKTEWNQ